MASNPFTVGMGASPQSCRLTVPCGTDSQGRDMAPEYCPKQIAVAGNGYGDKRADDLLEEMACARRRKKPHIDGNQRYGNVHCHSQAWHRGRNPGIARPSISYRLYRHSVSRALNRARRRPIITRSITTMFTRSGGRYPNNQPNSHLFLMISSKARATKASQCKPKLSYFHHHIPQTSSQILHALKTTTQKTNGNNSAHHRHYGNSAADLDEAPQPRSEDLAVEYLHNSPNYMSLLSLDIHNDEDQSSSDHCKNVALCQGLQQVHNTDQRHFQPCSQEPTCSLPSDLQQSSGSITSPQGHAFSSLKPPSTPYAPVHRKYSSVSSPTTGSLQPSRTRFPSCASNAHYFESTSESRRQDPSRSPECLSPPYSPVSPKDWSFPSTSASPSQSLPSVDSPNWSPDVDDSTPYEYSCSSSHDRTHSQSSPLHSSEQPYAPSCIPVSKWSSSSPISSKYRLGSIQGSPSALSQSTPAQVSHFPSRPISVDTSSPSSKGMQTCSNRQFQGGSPPIDGSPASWSIKSPSFPSRPLSLTMSSPSLQMCSDRRSSRASSPAENWPQYQKVKNPAPTASAAYFPPSCRPVFRAQTPKWTSSASPSSINHSPESNKSLMASLPCTTYFSRSRPPSSVHLDPSQNTLCQHCPSSSIMAQGQSYADTCRLASQQQQHLPSWCMSPRRDLCIERRGEPMRSKSG